jgi:hypothetical protein
MCYKSLLRNGAVIIAATLLTLAACKRNDTTNTTPALTNADDNGGYASDNAKMESNSSDAISIADVATKTGGAGNLRTTETTVGGCASVYDSVSSGDSFLVINFGPTDCTCRDYKIRRGEIIVHYSGRYKDSSSIRVITFRNYFVDDNQLSGIKTVQNMGKNGSGQVYYRVTVNDTLNLGPGNGEITWSGNRTRTWLAGYGSSTWSDDKYLIGGTTTLIRASGNSFTFAIDSSNQLQVASGCPYVEAGVVTITGTTLSTPRILNYGTGACDALATLTIGAHTYNITLH